MSIIVAVRRFPGLRATVAFAAIAAVAIAAHELGGARRSVARPMPTLAIHPPAPAPTPTPDVAEPAPPAGQDRPRTLPAAAPAAAPIDRIGDRIRRLDDTHFEIDRSLVDEVLASPVLLARGARVMPYYTDGVPAGIRLYAVRPAGLYARLGLKNGDTLLAIDGLPLTSADEALVAYTRLREVDRHALTIRRRNQELTLHYAIVDAPPAPSALPTPSDPPRRSIRRPARRGPGRSR